MKVLVTGITGFIGSRLALSLKNQGEEVIGLGLKNNSAESENYHDLEIAHIPVKLGGVDDKAQLLDLLKECDIVIHLAAAQHEAGVPDSYFHDINYQGTLNVLEAAAEAQVKHFIHGSTIGVYGAAMAGELSESSLVKPDNIYGTTKLKAEKLVASYAKNLPVTIIRISETYGPGDRRLLKLFKAIKRKTFFMIGNGKNIHQLIYIDDLIAGFALATEKPITSGEIFVLAGHQKLTTQNLTDDISQVLKVKPYGIKVPLSLLMLIAFIMEKVFPLFKRQPPIHRRRLDFFRKSFYFNTKKAKNNFGFEATTSFKSGAAKTAQWYKEKGLL